MKRKQTKTAFLIILTFICTTFISAQNYLITFSGSGQSNVVETVEVKNIAQQTTLTLSGTDTLHLTDVVGIGYLSSLNQGLNIYPNPADHASRLELYNSSAGNTRIEVYDFSGRLIILKAFQLDAGNHVFKISGLHAGIYLVKVNTPEHIYSRRLVSTSAQCLAPALQYEGINQSRQQEPDLKSISNVVAMQYNDGERLVIKAISGDFAHTKSLIPTQSQNIDFEFMDCIDGDGNHYGVVTIGEQVWMVENLKTTKYRNGTPIEYPGTDNTGWQYNTTGAYAWFENNIIWKDKYGALYNWHAVNNNNFLCPVNWHVPSDTEWTQLVDYVVAQGFPNELDNPNGAGNALKSCRQVNSPLGGNCNTSEHPVWNENSTHHGFDVSGFSGLPGGYRAGNGYSFGTPGVHGHWWSSTKFTAEKSWIRYLVVGNSRLTRAVSNMVDGFSVRCVRDN
jgi:uncharacterized protein (TIGR02145 family)